MFHIKTINLMCADSLVIVSEVEPEVDRDGVKQRERYQSSERDNQGMLLN